MSSKEFNHGQIAIIGMAGRFPGAQSVAELWKNLCEGRETIAHFKGDEVEYAAASATAPSPSGARGVLADPELFDAEFFGFLPREAELTDPQQRVLLECAWLACEDAGYDPKTYPGNIGVFAGSSVNTYLLLQLASDPEFIKEFTGNYQTGSFPALVGNGHDFLATRISYKLGLRGPAMTVQSACSTSLLAVAQACDSLRMRQSDMALAGGVSISFPQRRATQYQEGGMVSPDGHCRPFDANANGTVFGAGSGMVLLKRLEDAIEDGDPIYATILGHGINNDGAAKVGYAAPSVEGQTAAILQAHQSANVDVDTIRFVECHGTGTPLGDPIELAALSQAFRSSTQKSQFCAVGSLKSAVGHLDVAAGVTGLIKTALCLREKKLPPTLHFEKPNPHIDFENSPFYVNASLVALKSEAAPLRAGVSAFGVGGTNVHLVLEEAPERDPRNSARDSHLLLLSARTKEALTAQCNGLARYLEAQPEARLEDVSYTLASGRRSFPWRIALPAASVQKAIDSLSSASQKLFFKAGQTPPKIAFLFPGQGAQYPGMGISLYKSEPTYRNIVDHCAEILQPLLKEDIRSLIYPADDLLAAADRLRQTRFAQPALFITAYAAARLWMEWGILPSWFTGHSVGEYVAACLGGVFSLEDALRALALRGEWMQALPEGGMLALRMTEGDLRPLLRDGLSIAAINSPALCVVSGPHDSIAQFEKLLEQRGQTSRRLHTSHAFHSSMVDPVIEPLRQFFSGVTLHPSTIPIFSCVTGEELTDTEAVSPSYWARHCGETVRFYPTVLALAQRQPDIYLEVGPGTTLATLTRQSLPDCGGALIANSLPIAGSQEAAATTMLTSLGAMWTRGAELNLQGYFAHEPQCRIPLPSTPFDRKRYWVERHPHSIPGSASANHNACFSLPSPIEPAYPLPTEAPILMNASPATSSADLLNTELVQMFEELSGISLTDDNLSTSFMELGFDSLFLTQVAQEIQRRYTVKITFRQMLEDVSSVDALSAYVLSRLTPEAQARFSSAPAQQTTEQAPAPAALPATSIAAANLPTTSLSTAAPALESLFQQQLKAMSDLMQQQLQVFAQAPVGAVAPTAKSPVQSVSVTPATVPSTVAKATVQASEPAVELRTTSRFSQRPKSESSAAALNTAQLSFIRELTERYCARTARSKQYAQQYRQILADPRSVSGFRPEWKEMVYSIVCERSSGSKLYDIDGNEYIDLLNGFGPTMFGHEPSFVIDAVKEQLDKSFAIGPHTPLAGKAAELISELTGCERVTFCNTGSEAVMAAMRAARTVTGRDRVVFFAGDYHGQFDEVLVKGIRRGADFTSMPIAPGIPRRNIENVTVLEYGEQDALAWIEKHASEIAAVIVEPIQSRHPDLQPKQFLHSLRDLTERTGSALVFDEVVTGFRVHSGGAQAYFGIQADMATYGKVAGGGMPIGILAGKARFMDAFDGGPWQFGDSSYPEAGVTFFAGTFVRHPLGIAAVCATLEHIKQAGPALYSEMDSKSAAFAARMNSIFADAGISVVVERCASVMYFHLPQDAKFAGLFYYLLREKGVFFLEGFPLYLTTQHSSADLERVYQAVQESIAALQAFALLPGTPVQPRQTTVEEIPLTAPQLEVLLAAQAGDEPNCAFNESFSIYFDGALNREALASSWKKLIARHESLRTSLNASGDGMRISPDSEIPLQPIDLASLDSGEQQSRISALIEAEGITPFDLQSGPLLRALLITTAPDRHQLIVTAHHIVCDGWSINVLVEEWGQIYSSLIHGGQPELSPLLAYSEYARIAAAASEEKAGAESFWKNEFQIIPDLLDLPSDYPRRAQRSFAGATYFEKFSPELTKAVRKAGAGHGCTLFVTLLAAWQLVLSRLSGEHEPVTLIPSAAQSQFENSSLVGHCVHLLPIRSLIQPGQSASAFLRTVKESVLNAYDHQQITYGSLVHALNTSAPAGRLPLSEVQFNLERVAATAKFAGLATRFEANGKQFVNFDLFLNIVESPDGLRLECDYNTDLYRENTIRRWLGHYRTLLEAFAANPSATLSELPLLDAELRESLLVRHNQTAQPYPNNSSIPEVIHQQMDMSPDSIAVESYGRKLTRRQLEDRSDRVAANLQMRGIAAGDLVGIYIERSIDMLVALLGVLKSGAGYVPLDPLFPRERIQSILHATDMSLLLTLDSHLNELPESSTPTLTMSEASKATSGNNGMDAKPGPDSTAYVIFTSGSTGLPKGVEITHRSVVNLLCAAAKEVDFQPGDRLLTVTTLTFDIAALELLMPLAFGGTVVIARHQDSSDGMRLLELIKASRSNVLQATPITWRMLLDAGFSSWTGFKMLCGGEAWGRELADRLLSGGGRLWNMYGPTETTIWSSISEVAPGDAPVAIGSPLANTQFYVLDENMQPLPPGATGELYIGGDGLARGYFKNSELTASKFLPNPFLAVPGARVYKTGDLVRQSANGNIQFLRRSDHQIKLRGFRIELGEIEKAIESSAALRQVAVLLRQNSSGDPALVAYLVPQSNDAIDIEALRAALFTRLPEYMVPSWFVVLEKFPMTANGKVDRKALPLPDWQNVARKIDSVPPTTKTQVLIAQIWSEVLGITNIGIDDELLSLGADSLRMFQISSRCNRKGLPVNVRQLMKLKTIRAIEHELESSADTATFTGMGPIRKIARSQFSVSNESQPVAG
ncbi:MAG TPA: amino acid adenylation domain-containing protein [Silvibacterium sp.]|nr:amino acid adenylation domain-containing protein [Silvibacterium sp.]